MEQLRAKISVPGHNFEIRGRGLMVGLEITTAEGVPATALVLEAVKTMLHRGFILLPEGEFGNVDQFHSAVDHYPRPSCRHRKSPRRSPAMKLSEIKQILSDRNLILTKSLGQNFLHDQNQLRRIVAAAELTPTDKVLEIGPVLGR